VRDRLKEIVIDRVYLLQLLQVEGRSSYVQCVRSSDPDLLPNASVADARGSTRNGMIHGPKLQVLALKPALEPIIDVRRVFAG